MTIYTSKHRTPFLIDDEDNEVVSMYNWYVDVEGYVARTTNQTTDTIRTNTRLHVFLLGNAPEGLLWDHKNRNRLDYRRENLQLVSSTLNCRNRNLSSSNKTGYKGVQIVGNRFKATIGLKNTQLNLGSFKTLEEAIQARKSAEQLYW